MAKANALTGANASKLTSFYALKPQLYFSVATKVLVKFISNQAYFFSNDQSTATKRMITIERRENTFMLLFIQAIKMINH